MRDYQLSQQEMESIARVDVEGFEPTSSPPLKKSEREIAYRRGIMLEQFDFSLLGSTLYAREKKDNGHYMSVGEAGFKRLAATIMPAILDRDASILHKTMLMSTPLFDEDNLSHIRFGDQLWDMESANLVDFDTTPDSTSPRAPKNIFWWCPIAPAIEERSKVKEYFLSLADGNASLAEDIISSIAITFLKEKPRGAYWWMGDGMNGKGTLLRLLHSLFPGQICDIDTAKMQDPRELAGIASSLGNFVLDASEQRVDRTDAYKRIADHEPVSYRPLFTNDQVTITRSLNSIFAVNNMPVFEDKTRAISSRNKVIPFKANFTGFRPPEFTIGFKAALISILLAKAHEIYANGGHISWSETSREAMASYESEMNNASLFLDQEIAASLIAAENVGVLYQKYVAWCDIKKGQVALGRNKFGREMDSKGFYVADNIERLPGITRSDIDSAINQNGVYYRSLPINNPPATLAAIQTSITEGVDDEQLDW